MASIVSLGIGLGMTACAADHTEAYVYMTAAKADPGLINGYKVGYQLGSLLPLEDSPISTGGRNPVALAVSTSPSTGKRYVYAVNHDDSTIVLFLVGTDGKLYPQATYNTTGSFPTSVAVDSTQKFLYVTYTYQVGYTTALPGPGGVSIFPITYTASNGQEIATLGTASNVNVGRNPIAVVASGSNHFVYVLGQDTATAANLFGFSQNTTTGMLTPLPGITINSGNVPSTGYAASTMPGGLVEDASASHLYVSDQAANQVIGYSIASSGVPSVLGTATSDETPSGLTIDISGNYLYVANYTSGTISGYTFSSNGAPVRSTVASSVQAGTGTTCVTTIGAPSTGTASHGIYLYASNALSNSVTAEQLNPADGSLRPIQGTPFTGSTLPTCLVSIPATGR